MSISLKNLLTEAGEISAYRNKIVKEIIDYIKDLAKQFKVTGNTTADILSKLKQNPNAAKAVQELESIQAEFNKNPKIGIKFPEVKVDDKDLATPPTPATPDPNKVAPDKVAPDKVAPDKVAPDNNEISKKYAVFTQKLTSENINQVLMGLEITNLNGENKLQKPRNANNVVYFKVNPSNHSLFFKARVSNLDKGITLSYGSSDAQFANFEKAINSNYKLVAAKPVTEAVTPIATKELIGSNIINTLASYYSKMNTQTKGTNTFNPDGKTMPELTKDYVKVLTPLIKASTDKVSKSWMDAVGAAIANQKVAQNKLPSLKGKPFGVAFSSKGATYWYGPSAEERDQAGLKNKSIKPKSSTSSKPADKKSSAADIDADRDRLMGGSTDESYKNYRKYFR